MWSMSVGYKKRPTFWVNVNVAEIFHIIQFVESVESGLHFSLFFSHFFPDGFLSVCVPPVAAHPCSRVFSVLLHRTLFDISILREEKKMDNTIYRLGKLLLHYLHCHVNVQQKWLGSIGRQASKLALQKHIFILFGTIHLNVVISLRCGMSIGWCIAAFALATAGRRTIATAQHHFLITDASRCGCNNVILPTRLGK